MRKLLMILLVLGSVMCVTTVSSAQCSICTKTSMQQGEKAATGMNSGIIYLMLAPFAVMGYIGYRWWKSEHNHA